MARKVPASGINLFQLIYILIREYTERTGQKPLNLSLGNPDGVPDPRVLELQAKFAKDPAYDFHTYAEDKNINQFAELMVQTHTGFNPTDYPHLKALPIPGIKTTTALLPLACGLHLPDQQRRKDFHVVTNLPAYDVMGTWSNQYLATNRIVWPLLSKDNMRLNMDLLQGALDKARIKRPDLIFVIRPGNPAAVGASQEEWKALIEFCIKHQCRLVNDGAYTGLASANHVSLMSVAKDYPELEWAEMFSLSKSFNDPGARLGAIVGSKDFIDDYVMIKGNTESGPVPFVMAAYAELFKDQKLTQSILKDLQKMYQSRLEYLIGSLKRIGLRQACETDAGFFTLWKAPRRILGRDLLQDPSTKDMPLSEALNRTIISETGIVGVHFQGISPDGGSDPLIRYAVCADVLSRDFQSRFEKELARLQPEY